ncbi:hypothetical protein C8R45DRAFT_1218685 [Mycena sanguinolenta]|nr:hypothetical protein C8R45DRAFT_1218685 [Mycena sanguinolenta]
MAHSPIARAEGNAGNGGGGSDRRGWGENPTRRVLRRSSSSPSTPFGSSSDEAYLDAALACLIPSAGSRSRCGDSRTRDIAPLVPLLIALFLSAPFPPPPTTFSTGGSPQPPGVLLDRELLLSWVAPLPLRRSLPLPHLIFLATHLHRNADALCTKLELCRAGQIAAREAKSAAKLVKAGGVGGSRAPRGRLSVVPILSFSLFVLCVRGFFGTSAASGQGGTNSRRMGGVAPSRASPADPRVRASCSRRRPAGRGCASVSLLHPHERLHIRIPRRPHPVSSAEALGILRHGRLLLPGREVETIGMRKTKREDIMTQRTQARRWG